MVVKHGVIVDAFADTPLVLVIILVQNYQAEAVFPGVGFDSPHYTGLILLDDRSSHWCETTTSKCQNANQRYEAQNAGFKQALLVQLAPFLVRH